VKAQHRHRFLETDGALTPDQARQIRDSWEEAHYKHRKPAVLQGGLKWRSVTTSAADMQMLEHKESIIRDIARVYRIPLHLIIGTGGDSARHIRILKHWFGVLSVHASWLGSQIRNSVSAKCCH
jgi:phage portal protein BeeE